MAPVPPRRPRLRSGLALLAISVTGACATGGGGSRAVALNAAAEFVSAPIGNIHYEVTFDSATAARQTLRVAMTFTPEEGGPVILSLPSWTPGAYEISNFARWVTGFEARADGQPLGWDRADQDSWRVVPPAGAREVTVSFDYRADTLDNAMAWSRPDFAFFNGTNVFLHPEGRSMQFPATVTVRTQPGWRVATGMTPTGTPGSYGEGNYHDLVDMPFFVGRFDLDSTTVADRPVRLATYPVGAIAGQARAFLLQAHQRMLPPQIAVFGEVPFTSYTTMIVVTDQTPGGSALEHQNSHIGIYNPGVLNPVTLPSITAHEIFHLWNVKRLRPVEMWPYDYSRPMPTTLLWASEGITDYYADIALVRGGVIDSATFLALTAAKIAEVGSAPPVALEDASLATWIHPIENAYVYYPKGSLAGLMFDIWIRDASDNAGSLDTVMRELYEGAYRLGRGFTNNMFWDAASRAAGGRSFRDEYSRYIDGRERYPWERVLPLAGLRLVTDTLHTPMLGIRSRADSAGTRVMAVTPGSVAERAGVAVDDRLVSVGDVRVSSEDFGPAFRGRYAGRAGAPLPIVVERDGRTLTLNGRVELSEQLVSRIVTDPAAPPKAVRIRNAIFHGAP
ncbi:MAG: M61 family metallopeptidase [Gemmatimonadaceae bacterium]